MEYLDRATIIAFLNEMLDAERAGSHVTLRTSQQCTNHDVQEIAMAIHHDEARWCSMLLEMIKDLNGEASIQVGAFYEKAMAISDLRLRFTFLNKGQKWVARKLRETIPQIADADMRQRLEIMLKSHEDNITKVIEMGLTT